MVGAGAPPPDSAVLAFNSAPILVKEVTPYQRKSSPILAGPRPSATHSDSIPGFPKGDPWSNWQGPRVMPDPKESSRPMQGPVEQRFAMQDTRIQQLEQ